jgi:hypothetical protein
MKLLLAVVLFRLSLDVYKHTQITRSVTYAVFPDTCGSQNKNSSVSAICKTVYYLLQNPE